MIIIQRCYNYNIKIQVLQKCFSQKYIQESFVCSGGVEVLLLNKDMLHTLLNQLWRVVAGPALLICIPLFLTPVEQGYWYTFTSIAALAVFADLGFSTIILQFTAHEFAHLSFAENGTICGDVKALWRLASFFHFCLSWLGKAIGIVFPAIVIGGWLFLQLKDDGIAWHGAWLLYSVMSAWSFFNVAMLSFFEGCNSVARVQKIRMILVIINSGTMLAGLYSDMGLWALACGMLLSALAGTGLLWRNFCVAVQQLWKAAVRYRYDWWPEFSGLIWRYAVSWGSGYFIFQLFVPLAFAFFGADYAGKTGMSIAAWTAGFNISFAWMTAVIPRINMLIEKKNWQALDDLFVKRCTAVLATMALGGSAFFVLYFIFDDISFFQRVLPLTSMVILFLCWLCQAWVNSIAVYLRGHKEEPLMKLSAFSAVYVAVTTFFCARYLAEDWLFAGFFSSYLWGIPLIYRIYAKFKARHGVIK